MTTTHSYYDRLSATTDNSTRKIVLGNCIGAALIAVILFKALSTSFLIVLLSIPPIAVALHFGAFIASAKYRGSIRNTQQNRCELKRLAATTSALYSERRKRNKCERFKDAYSLVGKSVAELEHSLAVGMLHEKKEVFVTVFIQNGVAVRVTAAIGSANRCKPADKPSLWSKHFKRLGCDEIRQYHNHPHFANATQPSGADIRMCKALKYLLGIHAPKYRAFILYWNAIREWRILEYNEQGGWYVCTYYDAQSGSAVNISPPCSQNQ